MKTGYSTAAERWAAVTSRDTEADVPLLSGRIDGDKIKALLPLVGPVADIEHVYLCGPGNLIECLARPVEPLY